jgi:hypothetical protein
MRVNQEMLERNIHSLFRFVFFAALIIGVAAMPFVGSLRTHFIGVGATILLVLVADRLANRQNLLLAVVSLIVLGWLSTTVLVAYSGGFDSPFLIVYFAVVFWANLFWGRLGGWATVAMVALSSAVLVALERSGNMPMAAVIYALPDLYVTGGVAAFLVFGISMMVGNSNQLTADLIQRNQELSKAYDQILEGYAKALEMRDGETREHSLRAVELTLALAMSFGFGETDLDRIRRGVLLHDIGKIGVPDPILLKPGPLDDSEWGKMREHPLNAKAMLEETSFLEGSLSIPLYHHERWDGSGYPYGLAQEQIPLEARIFAVVDVWDALLSPRPYRGAWSRGRARAYIQEHADVLFDPEVVSRFLAMV